MLSTYALGQLVPAWPNCGSVAGFVNSQDSCGCSDAWSQPIPGTSVCECLDKTLTWMPNGSACSLGTERKAAYVNAMRTRFEPFNNAASRAAKDSALANQVTAVRLGSRAEMAACNKYCSYRGYWNQKQWFYG